MFARVVRRPSRRRRHASGNTGPVLVPIEDAADPRLADYVDLTDVAARQRREGDEFFITEGPVAIERLLQSDHHLRSVLVSLPKYERLAPLLDGLPQPVYVAGTDVLKATVGFDIHRGAVASADRRPLPALETLLRTARRIAVLEGLNDPENLGAIARSARAFGIGRIGARPDVHRSVLPADGAGEHGRDPVPSRRQGHGLEDRTRPRSARPASTRGP